MNQKLRSGGQEQASKVPDLHSKICNLGPKGVFFPKAALEPAENGKKKEMQLDVALPKGPLRPSNYTRCLQTAPIKPLNVHSKPHNF